LLRAKLALLKGERMAKTNESIETPIKTPKEDRKLQRRLDIGERLRALRKRRGYNLVKLSEALGKRGYSLSASQLSRIETGEAPANTDDLSELVDLFQITWEKLLGPIGKPWYVVRKSTAKKRLQEVRSGKRVIIRHDQAHEDLIKKGVYLYVPLEQSEDYVLKGDSEEGVKLDDPLMQKYLFEIGTADEDEVIDGLDNHTGEEIIYVIKGEVEFWFEQEYLGKIDRCVLKEGDCLHYRSSMPHGYRATGRNEVAEALFVYCDVRSTPPPLTEEGQAKSEE
jgi:transcriptional regulator with XRE-family HTH domain